MLLQDCVSPLTCRLFVRTCLSESNFFLMVAVCLDLAAKLRSVRDVLCVSGLELQRLTGLSLADIRQLLTAAASACRTRPPVPGPRHILTEHH